MDESKGRGLHVAVGRQIRLSALGSDEAIHWRQLTEIIRALTRVEGVNNLLQFFLTATLELLEADRGHVRLLNEATGEFELRGQHGFDDISQAHLAALCDTPVHTRVLRVHGRVLVEDVKDCSLLQPNGTLCRDVLLAARCRAIQATPLLTTSRKILGVVTTYHEMPCEPSNLQLRLLDVLCMQVAELLERAKEKEALLASARRKDDFLATLAHELRNSIAPLRSSLEILKLARLEHPLHARARAILDRRLDHATRLIDDLMDASRIARGKLQLRSQRIPLTSILESALEIATPIITEFEHELTTTLPDRDVIVEGDPVRLTQAFVNLLHNAAKYTPGGGQIHLGVARHGGGVNIEIRDNGIGITTESIPHVFEMFTQASSAEQRRHGGLGIGLALVKGVVDMHGGAVHVASAGRDQGSTFTVWLPTISSHESRQHVTDILAVTKGPHVEHLRVLIVDDDRDAAESLASLLTLHGHDVRTAYDGVDAVQTTSQFYPDLILLDLVMPRMDGLEAAARIRQLPLPHQPEIIELTGHVAASDASHESAIGIGAHLLKPVDFGTIQELLAITARSRRSAVQTGGQLLINNIDLALTLLATADASQDPVKRASGLGNARRAYYRAAGLLRHVKLDDAEVAAIEERLQRLEAELSAAGYVPHSG
jgi:CheY-like chemotaxis protein/nitrogen-specific signal transduction histidine kinase